MVQFCCPATSCCADNVYLERTCCFVVFLKKDILTLSHVKGVKEAISPYFAASLASLAFMWRCVCVCVRLVASAPPFIFDAFVQLAAQGGEGQRSGKHSSLMHRTTTTGDREKSTSGAGDVSFLCYVKIVATMSLKWRSLHFQTRSLSVQTEGPGPGSASPLCVFECFRKHKRIC